MINNLCCYCGVKEATTKDHVPPKAIFNKPRPSDLITVPACIDCNNGASAFDEKFKVYLGMHVARFRKRGEVLFKQSVLRSVRHNNSLRQNILKTVRPVIAEDESGKKIDGAVSILWDSEAHDQVIDRITRGLFYHHFGMAVKASTIIRPTWYKKLPDIDLSTFIIKSIGNGDFVYAYGKAEESDDSAWLYQFYEGHWSGAVVEDQLKICIE